MMLNPIQTVNANGTQIAYERYGDKQSPVILLIHGLGMPMTVWPKAMINIFVEQGFQVLILDNRDQGQSQKFDHLKVPNVLWQFVKLKMGFSVTSPYALTDLASDTIGLLDALDIDSVHVVGASMGGMISQILAIEFPERIKTLTSIMSTTGNRRIPQPTKEMQAHLLAKPKMNAEEDVIAYHLKTWTLIASPKYPTPTEELRQFVLGLIERGVSAGGTVRQLLAIISAPSRVKALSKLKLPVLVIHGTDDPLVRVEGGIDTANAIAHAEQHLIEGMGHDLPSQLHHRICELIIRQALEAEGALTKKVK